MIYYDKGSVGLSIDFWLHILSNGSALPRAAVLSLASVLIYIILYYNYEQV